MRGRVYCYLSVFKAIVYLLGQPLLSTLIGRRCDLSPWISAKQLRPILFNLGFNISDRCFLATEGTILVITSINSVVFLSVFRTIDVKPEHGPNYFVMSRIKGLPARTRCTSLSRFLPKQFIHRFPCLLIFRERLVVLLTFSRVVILG